LERYARGVGLDTQYLRRIRTLGHARESLKLIFYSWRRFAPCKLLILFVWRGVVCKSVVPRHV
jgi:hypothetical protein